MEESLKKIPVNVIKGSQCGIVEDPLKPGGLQWVDIWLDSLSKPGGPVQTTRFRLPVEHLDSLMEQLSEIKKKLRSDDAAKPRH